MGILIDCGKVNPMAGCGHLIRADTEEELLRLAAEHAKQEHAMEPTAELMELVKAHIQRDS